MLFFGFFFLPSARREVPSEVVRAEPNQISVQDDNTNQT
jgi:hypothetical protein